jgi:hypothetical protein
MSNPSYASNNKPKRQDDFTTAGNSNLNSANNNNNKQHLSANKTNPSLKRVEQAHSDSSNSFVRQVCLFFCVSLALR